jgi:hypothetical protein
MLVSLSQPTLKVGFQVIGQIGDAGNLCQRGWVISLRDFRLLGDAHFVQLRRSSVSGARAGTHEKY